MNIRKIDNSFAITGQIQPEDVKSLADAGYRGIVCVRPDDEDAGQPDFEQIEKAAREAGIKAMHIPVSGPLTEGQLIRFEQAMAQMDGPVLGYCRSGGRAGSLYQARNKQ